MYFLLFVVIFLHFVDYFATAKVFWQIFACEYYRSLWKLVITNFLGMKLKMWNQSDRINFGSKVVWVDQFLCQNQAGQTNFRGTDFDVTSHYISSHYISSHYISSHYISSHYMTVCRVNAVTYTSPKNFLDYTNQWLHNHVRQWYFYPSTINYDHPNTTHHAVVGKYIQHLESRVNSLHKLM